MPTEIRRDDQAALNANIDRIARGDVVVIQPPKTTRQFPSDAKLIVRGDYDGISRNLEAVARGDVTVVNEVEYEAWTEEHEK